MLNFSLLGMVVLFMLDCQRVASGFANCSWQLVRRIAGKPSGPDAADGLSSLIASTISSQDTTISVIVLTSS